MFVVVITMMIIIVKIMETSHFKFQLNYNHNFLCSIGNL